MTTNKIQAKLKLMASMLVFVLFSFNIHAINTVGPLKITVKGSGKPMILIPGLNSAISVWEETVAHYQDNYECHLVQLAGFAGAKAIAFDSVYLDKVKTALIQYIQKEQLDKPVIIGHSLGGFVTMLVGAEKPDLLGPMVIVDSVPFLPGLMNPAATAKSMIPMAQQMRTQMANQSPEQMKATLPQYLAPLVIGEEKLQVLVDWGVSSDTKTSAQAMFELYTTDLREDIANIKSPALVLAAWIGYKNYGATRENTLFNYTQQYSKFPNHQIKMTDKGKHFIMWDDPEFFFANIDQFLADNQK